MSIISIKGQTTEQHEKNLAILQRFFLGSDDSGHEYVVPLALKAEFNAWAEADTEAEDFDPGLFDKYRFNGGLLTFTDPRTN
jgi:hypothetical protein